MLAALICRHPAMRLSSALLAISALLCTSLDAYAWGKTGHRIVGDLAQARLNPIAKAAVSQLLQGEADPTLGGIASWADYVRESVPEYQWTVPLHWVNFEKDQCHYHANTNCKEGLCVVGGIERFSKELADLSLPLERRRDALKFVVHFVGDIHQPLHAGFAFDRGGNDFQISIQREGWNLHSVWDSLIIDSLKIDAQSYLTRLDQQALTSESSQIVAISAPSNWAEESCQIMQRADFYPPRHKITGRYLEAKRPQADQRLKLAGERLASLLNQILGGG